MNPTTRMNGRQGRRSAGLLEDLLLTFVLVAAVAAAVADGIIALNGPGAF